MGRGSSSCVKDGIEGFDRDDGDDDGDDKETLLHVRKNRGG